MPIFPQPLDSMLVVFLGLIALVAGIVQAVRNRRSLPSLFRWLCLMDVGYLLVGFGSGGSSGDAGVWMQLLFTGLARVLAYLCMERLCSAARATDVAALRGIGRSKPLTATLFAFAMFAALGVSPFMTPDAKPLIMYAALVSGQWLAPAVLVCAASVMTVLTVIAVHGIWLESGRYEESAEPSGSLTLPLGLTAVLALMGVFGHSLADWAGGGAEAGMPSLGAHWSWAALALYAGAFVVWLAGRYTAEGRNKLACVVAGIGFVAALFSTGLPPLGYFFAVVVTGVGLLVTIYSVGYIHGKHENAYYFFLLLTFGSLAGIAASPDLGSLYVFWELMTLASYVLVAWEGTAKAHAAAIKYYIMCTVGAAVMLPGLLLLATRLGSLEIVALSASAGMITPALATVATLLVLVGFGVKAGLVPGHGWLPDAHPAAPSSVSAPLSGVLTKAGIFGIVQVMLIIIGVGVWSPTGETIPGVGVLICVLGTLTMLYGEIMALQQQDIKRLLAYSTMGQIGEITMTLGLCTYLAVTGALFHVLNHAIMKDLLFLCSGALILRAGSRNLKDLRGLGKAMPFTATCMVIGLISILGLPPFAGFMSKYLMLTALATVSPFMAGLLLLGSLAGCVYYMRIIRTLLFEPYEGPAVEEAPLSMRVPLGILAGLSLLIGLFPGIGLALVQPIADNLAAGGKIAAQSLPLLSISWPSYTVLLMLGAAVPVLLRKDPQKAGNATAAVLAGAFVLVLLFGRGLDTLSFLFALVITGMGWVNMRYAAGYMNHSHTQWRFYAFFLFMTAGLTGVAASRDLFNFFLFWEIMSSWSLYFVIVHEENAAALREGFKYFFFNVLGAAFLFLGVVLLCYWSGGASFETIRQALPELSAGQISLSLFLMATGFVMKAAQLPFRIDIQMHPATAPTPVSGYISSVLLKSALFGLVKLLFVFGAGTAVASAGALLNQPQIMSLVLWIGGITIVMAAGFAVFQSDVKLVFIYSTVSQLGYMVVGIALGTSLGVAGGLLHLFNHVLFKDLLFLVAGSLIVQTHRQSMNQMGGLGARMPLTLAFFIIGALCVIGVPPSSGFTSKWIIYHALMERGEVLIAILSLAGSVITLAYLAKMLHVVFLGHPAKGLEQVTEAPRSMLVPMGLLAAGCVVTSVFPGLILAPVNSVLAELSMETLDVAPWGLASGPGAWNATVACILAGAAWYGGRLVLGKFTTKTRCTSVHTCGIPPEELNLRTTSGDIYSAPGQVYERILKNNPVIRKLSRSKS